MSVSYAKLREIMIKNKIKHEVMRLATGCTTSEIAKINKDEYMTLQSLESVTKYLSGILKQSVGVDDIISFIDD
jgi:DNA-binding Xre family transcriptional regulator